MTCKGSIHSSPTFTLMLDHIQGDAYAAPSRVRVVMPWSETGFPDLYLQTDIRRIALADMVTRYAAAYITAQHFNNNVGEANGGWSGPKGGAFNINAPGQEVLPRTSAVISGHETTELRFTVALPAKGRTIMGLQARQILVTNLPKVVKMALLYANVDHTALRPHATSVENQHHLRNELRSRNMVAFVANGSMLARASGPSALPMKGQDAVTFRSPPELEVSMQLEDGTEVSGMAIPRGITLLTGGGFHGKSTLLEALQLGVYDHVPGDGRELIVTDPTAVKVRAEDGRFVAGVDISPFMSELPGGKDTKSFSTGDASGSTSMAASIQEALEMGCTTLMIDEDSSATNLLVRDQRMQSLIKREPITLLVSKVRALYEVYGVSTIIVVGGLGDWLSVADNVILMEAYRPNMVNIQAQAVVKRYPSMVAQDEVYGSFPNRMIRLRYPDGLKGNRGPQAQTMSFITIRPAVEDPVANPAKDADGIDLSGLEQIVEVGQTRTIAGFVHRLADGAAPEG